MRPLPPSKSNIRDRSVMSDRTKFGGMSAVQDAFADGPAIAIKHGAFAVEPADAIKKGALTERSVDAINLGALPIGRGHAVDKGALADGRGHAGDTGALADEHVDAIDTGSVQQWMREKHVCEDANPTSWKLCLIGALSLSLAIVTAFGAKSVVANFFLNTADSILPARVHRGTVAAANSIHAQARKTAMAGDLDRAVEMYKKAEQDCDPENPARAELLNDLGVALTAAGKNDEAARYLKEAIQLNPSLIAAYNNLAISQMLSGDKNSALTTLDDAVRVQPQNEYAALKLKRMWVNSEQTK